MQKIKMMLLSLALFAVVGGALAFKAKFHNTWCSTDAYFNSGSGTYYCDFVNGSQGVTTTTCGGGSGNSRLTTDPNGTVLKFCTTTPTEGTIPCATLCTIQETLKVD